MDNRETPWVTWVSEMGNKRGASGFGEKALGSVVHMLDFVMSVGIELVLSSRMWVKERDVRGWAGTEMHIWQPQT